ncbi:MAG: hypothetical protein WCD04_20945 [Terriglobia bacterium]|jgi:hypothetical protein
MFSSEEEAFSLFRKWNSEKLPMRFVFTPSYGGGIFSGTIAEVTRTTVRLTGAGFELTLSLLGARFEYDESREAPAPLRDLEYVARVIVVFPSGDRIGFFELPTY